MTTLKEIRTNAQGVYDQVTWYRDMDATDESTREVLRAVTERLAVVIIDLTALVNIHDPNFPTPIKEG